MKQMHFIALDVHSAFSECAVVSRSGRVLRRQRCATAIPQLTELILSVPRPRRLCFEEGPLADWLYRSLAPLVDELVVCDPRRNHLIAKESDKDDAIDAEKLAQLHRGGYLKAVYHPESQERAVFKQHVALYYDRVRHRVREANRLIWFLRRYGVFVQEADFADADARPPLERRLPAEGALRTGLQCLWESYDLAVTHETQLRASVVLQARGNEAIQRFQELPGIAWLRGATFFVYLDTPWRFKSKQALWKYMGIGLERRQSGNGPVRLQVVRRANRILKGAILGAAQTAIRHADNPFARQYDQWRTDGLAPPEARRNVARSLAATLWGLWKNNTRYEPQWVGSASRRNQRMTA